MSQDIYPIEIAGVKRDLRLFEVKPGLRIAILNILGDVELVEACANELAKQLEGFTYHTILTAESKYLIEFVGTQRDWAQLAPIYDTMVQSLRITGP